MTAMEFFRATLALVALILPQCLAQTCAPITSPAGTPKMASGYQAKVLMNGLKSPRGLAFDQAGNLLIIEQGGGGLRQVQLTMATGLDVCVNSSKQIINDATLNHGIDLSQDGKTLYVSSSTTAFSYSYDAAAGTVGAKTTIVTGMAQGGGHQTRTLLVSKFVNDTLLMSRGSNANIDLDTENESSGRSMIKIFNPSKLTTASVDYSTGGTILGWGLRNSVGVAEHPVTGGIFSVENSCDDLQRPTGTDIHTNNPGEEMNYHGALKDTTSSQYGANYGYPTCFAAWDPSVITPNTNITVGSNFVSGTPSTGNNTDAFCQTQRLAPRLTFPAHTAPLDIKFNMNGTAAYISFHGSWDRQPPDGYRVSRVNFANGQPVEPSTSTTATIDIMQNNDPTTCGQSATCFRPAGLVFDDSGRLYVSSDATNEVWVITGPF